MAKVASVEGIEIAPNGEGTVHVKDDSGRAYVLRMSPRAQAQMLDVMLASPVLRPGGAMPRGPLLPVAVEMIEDVGGNTILEARLNDRNAVHILLQPTMVDRIRALLNSWVKRTN